MLPNIHNQFPQWYQSVIYQAELVDHSPVRGTMVIRPYGYAIWENIKQEIDCRIKNTGHHNVSFPLFIPESFLKKEAQHVEGFSPELAVVTYAGGKELDEPLVVRPTSETLVHHMFARWIQSWRDLPLKINQWANVVRWELRPRPFLRTTEFFWQEGHTAHATREEADQEVELMIREYVDFIQNHLAIPVITGTKSEAEKFPGAETTITMEAIMPDGKALQVGTSHLLSQNFAKAFEITFQDQQGISRHPYLTSWAITTRLIGALIMMHGDQKGLVLPPKIAPFQVVIIPILKTGSDNSRLLSVVETIEKNLVEKGIRIVVDKNDSKTPGAKFYHWELKGVPLRIEIGPRDLSSNKVVIVDRLTLSKEATDLDSIYDVISKKLTYLQQELLMRAEKKVKNLMHTSTKLGQFGEKLAQDGGAYQVGWCMDRGCEEQLKSYKASIRCLISSCEASRCFYCDKASKTDILVAKAY